MTHVPTGIPTRRGSRATGSCWPVVPARRRAEARRARLHDGTGGHEGPAATPAPVAAGKPLRAGETFADARDARGLHAVRARRRRHRRLPVLHARPELAEDAFLTGTRHPPGQPGRRAPRDPVPGAAGRRSPTREPTDDAAERRRAGPASAARASAVDAGESLDYAPWLGAWAPGGGRQVHRTRLRHPAGQGHPGGHAGALQPARRRASPTPARRGCGSPPATRS